MLNLSIVKNEKKELVVTANREGFQRPNFIKEEGNMSFHDDVFQLSDWSMLNALTKKEAPTDEEKLKLDFLKAQGVLTSRPIVSKLVKLVCIGLKGFRGSFGVPESFSTLYSLAKSYRKNYMASCESWSDERKADFSAIREEAVNLFYKIATDDTRFNENFKFSISSGDLNLWLEKVVTMDNMKEGSKKAGNISRGIGYKTLKIEDAFKWYCALVLISSGLKVEGKKVRLVDMTF